jgi:arylsulfatase A-like enzyme
MILSFLLYASCSSEPSNSTVDTVPPEEKLQDIVVEDLVTTNPAPDKTKSNSTEAICPNCDVILITVCSLRRDHVGIYGSSPAKTPAIDALAAGSFRFDTAYAASAFTLSSLTAILTGQFGSSTGVLGWDKGLVKEVTTLPEILGYYGYSTAGYTIDAPSGFRPDYGLDQGFQKLHIAIPPADTPDGAGRGKERGPGGSALPAAKWLKEQPKDEPIFLMYHSRTAHYPFVYSEKDLKDDPTGVTQILWNGERGLHDSHMPGMSGGNETQGAVERKRDLVMETMMKAGEQGQKVWDSHYANAVTWMDHDIDVIVKALEERGTADRTIIVLVADHGESLGQHGEMLHGDAYFDEVVRIPMIMSVPGLNPSKPIKPLVSHVDILPTILELVGAVPPSGIDGTSMLPLLNGSKESIRETSLVEGSAVWPKDGIVRGAVISPPWTLLRQDLGCNASTTNPLGPPGTPDMHQDLQHEEPPPGPATPPKPFVGGKGSSQQGPPGPPPQNGKQGPPGPPPQNGAGFVQQEEGGGPIPCLYNIENDPMQLQDLNSTQPEKSQQLVDLWDSFAQARAGQIVPEQLRLDPKFIKMLQVSGYDFRPVEPSP